MGRFLKLFRIRIVFVLFLCVFILSITTGCRVHVDMTVKYTLSDDESYYVVTGFEADEDTNYISIKDSYEGIPVKEIAEYAFRNSSCIGASIPSSVEKIGYGAFEGCSNLEIIEIPYVGDKEVDSDAVDYNTFGYIFGYIEDADNNFLNVTQTNKANVSNTYTIPTLLYQIDLSSDAYIPYHAFEGLSMVGTIDMPNNTISDSALEGCSNLDTIGYNTSKVTSIASLFGTEETKESYLVGENYVPTSLYRLEIHGDITSPITEELILISNISIYDASYICSNALPTFSNLKSIKIQSSEDVVIDTEAFMGLSAINDIYIYANVDIKSKAFYKCLWINKFVVYQDILGIGSEAFYNCTTLEYIEYGGELSNVSSNAIVHSNTTLKHIDA
ncbi:MAG: leucine-rich repeat domain-containing protein [Acholeplasmatales bacterium]|nr:leucine-rich repeat domain-containing protein [Acholeplasmatales bacterium]